jgi:hypothetical protein
MSMDASIHPSLYKSREMFQNMFIFSSTVVLSSSHFFQNGLPVMPPVMPPIMLPVMLHSLFNASLMYTTVCVRLHLGDVYTNHIRAALQFASHLTICHDTNTHMPNEHVQWRAQRR